MRNTLYGIRLAEHKRLHERNYYDVNWVIERAVGLASLEQYGGHAVITLARSGRVIAGFFRDEKNT